MIRNALIVRTGAGLAILCVMGIFLALGRPWLDEKRNSAEAARKRVQNDEGPAIRLTRIGGMPSSHYKSWGSAEFSSFADRLKSITRQPERSEDTTQAIRELASRRPDLFLSSSAKDIAALGSNLSSLSGLLESLQPLVAAAGSEKALWEKNPALAKKILDSIYDAEEFRTEDFHMISNLVAMSPDGPQVEILVRYLAPFDKNAKDPATISELRHMVYRETGVARTAVAAKLVEILPLESQPVIDREMKRVSSDAEKTAIADGFVRGFLKIDPKEGLSRAATTRDQRSRELLLSKLLERWLEVDPVSASSAVGEVLQDEDRKVAARIIVNYLTDKGNTEEAAQWSAYIEGDR